MILIHKKHTHRTRVAKPPSSWIDDYLDWLYIDFCCKIQKDNVTFCPSNSKSRIDIRLIIFFFLFVQYKSLQKFNNTLSKTLVRQKMHYSILDLDCDPCPRAFEEISGINRPTVETYEKYLPFFLEDIPDPNCAKAGKAAYYNVRQNSKQNQ